jgi:hypothetical protein
MEDEFVELSDPYGKDLESPESEVMEFLESLGGQLSGYSGLIGIAQYALKALFPPCWKFHQRNNDSAR